MAYSKEQLDEYLKAMRESDAGKKYSDEEWAEYSKAIQDQYQAEEPGTGAKLLDYGVRALDYAGGHTRNAAAQLLGAAEEGDFDRALQGQAPSTSELLERAGYGEGGSLSDVIPDMYSDTGDEWLKLKKGGFADPTARGTVGFVGDVLLDPLTYASLGTSAAAKVAGKEGGKTLLANAVKKANVVLNPLEKGLESAGRTTYKSGLKDLDKVTRAAGKSDVSDTLLKYGVRGNAESIRRQANELMTKLIGQRDELLTKADEAGAAVSMRDSMAKAQGMIDEIRASKDPNLQDVADIMQGKIDEFTKLEEGKRVREFGIGERVLPADPITSSQASGYKTTLYQGLPDSSWDKAVSTPKGAQIQKEMALGLKNAVEQAAEKASGVGDEVAGLNYDLGELLTSRRGLKTQANKEATRNTITPIDAIVMAASPQAAVAKKAADLAKTSALRTQLGYGMYQTGKNASGVLDPLARRTFWELIGGNPYEQENQ